jgi:hypothetical protein
VDYSQKKYTTEFHLKAGGIRECFLLLNAFFLIKKAPKKIASRRAKAPFK